MLPHLLQALVRPGSGQAGYGTQDPPEDPEYHNLLGQTQDALGLVEDAEASLRKSIALDGRYAMGYYDLGVILARRSGRAQEAAQSFEYALTLDPELLWAYYGRACLHALAGQGM